MKSIDQDEVFLEHYYKCYNNLRIFIVAAIQAAENLGFQEQDNKNRIDVAEKKEKTFLAKEKKYTEFSTTNAATEEMVPDVNDTNVVSLQNEAEQAIDMLVQARQDQWYLLVQDILDGKSENTQISKEEAELLAQQFEGRANITVAGLLSAIKDNMHAMMQRIAEGMTYRSDHEQEKERARTFKRWLRWNAAKIQQEIDFLSHIDKHFFDITIEKEDRLTPLLNNINQRITVPTNPPKCNEIKQTVRLLSSRQVFKNSYTSQSTKDKNRKLVETAISGLSILVDNIVTEEDFSWYFSVKDDLQTWKQNLIDQKSMIHNTYDLKNNLDALEKSFTELDTALANDEKLKNNINEHFDTQSAHKLSEEAITQFKTLKKHLKSLREKLDENVIVRFFKNIFSAVYHWRETGRLALKWMRANPWTSVGIGVLIAALIGLTAFAPYASLPLVMAFGVSVATADAIATASVVIGAVTLGAVVASSTAGAGSLVKTEQHNKMSELEKEVEEAEERANEAEKRASAAEAAYRRKKIEGYASEKEVIAAEKQALLARIEALNAADYVLTVKSNLDRAKAQEMERAALPQNPTSQAVARVNIQTEEDNLDSMIGSLEASKTKNIEKQVELTNKREKIVADINQQREEISQTALTQPDMSNIDDAVVPTTQPNIPNMTVSMQNLRHNSMYKESEVIPAENSLLPKSNSNAYELSHNH